jgi:hypothetical protein
MIRGTLAANSIHSSVYATPGNGVSFQRRPTTGGGSLSTPGGSGTAPVWLKLERRGTAVTAFRSPDGTTWTMIGSETMTLPQTFYVGLAVSSHDSTQLATAVFDNVAVRPVNAGPQPPTVALTSPANGATFSAPATIDLAANASDTDDGVAEVQFFAGQTLIGTDTTSPYTATWSNVAAGTYTLTAVARDQGGLTTTSASRTVTVTTTTNQPPTAALTAPANGATFTAPASVTISANASDTDGTVARVDFYSGTSLLGSDTTSPYSFTWSNVPAGTYSLTAVALDNAGAQTTSAARTITVNNPPMASHAVFNASSNHDTAVTSYRLDIFTNGADPNTATPIQTQNLAKPAVANGAECSVDISATIQSLPSGTYIATVTAIGPGGTARSSASPPFTR